MSRRPHDASAADVRDDESSDDVRGDVRDDESSGDVRDDALGDVKMPPRVTSEIFETISDVTPDVTPDVSADVTLRRGATGDTGVGQASSGSHLR